MKKYSLITLIALFVGFSALGQVDRSKIPASGPTPKVNLNDPEEIKFKKNGLTVLVANDTKFPVVRWSLNLNNPPVFEGEKAGVQSLTGSLLGKETQLNNKDEFAEKVDFLGASISVSPNGGFGYCLAKYKEEVFSLFAEAALKPKFTGTLGSILFQHWTKKRAGNTWMMDLPASQCFQRVLRSNIDPNGPNLKKNSTLE